MYLVERFWAIVTSVFSVLTLSPLQDGLELQNPLNLPSRISPLRLFQDGAGKGPSFEPPGDSPKHPFRCHYPEMVGWVPCSKATDRTCWLRNPTTGQVFDIHTNYENYAPKGVLREYYIELNNGTWDADGLPFTSAKLFNNTYPGPWIEACWGDTVEVTVKNNLPNNGTSIHWHGVRQNQTMHMDGVNGVTQCPLAPGDTQTYKFNVTQYGSSWYHSHYSVQYADGALGPLTFYGPSSYEYTEAISPPLIITDWGHNSAFETVHTRNFESASILLNGKGNVTNFNNSVKATTKIQAPYHITFEKAKYGRPIKKYLLRIINTSFDTTFVFSIDHHKLRIASADFVPIYPYESTSVLVGIGQRYNVIVEANPLIYNDGEILPEDGNYWIRTEIAKCGSVEPASPTYERTGILRYNPESKAYPMTEKWANISTVCADETYTDLSPVLPWKLNETAVNGVGDKYGEMFSLFGNFKKKNETNPPYNKTYPLSIWSLEGEQDSFVPMRIDYGDPIFTHLNNTGPWQKEWRVVPEDFGKDDWVYLVIEGRKRSTYGAHPMHLHGHDFALVEQAYNKKFDINTWKPKYDNPPRRDVVLLPNKGYIVIAFKADNPGAWLLHCHIAFHISEGLGLQIMERQKDADEMWHYDGEAMKETERVCKNWRKWQSNKKNWANKGVCNGTREDYCFQDDSGV